MIYYVSVYDAGVWNCQKLVRVDAETPKEAAEVIVGPPTREAGSRNELVALVWDNKDTDPVATIYWAAAGEADE